MSSVRKIISRAVFITIVVGAIIAVNYRQYITDEVRLRQYQPSHDIARIAERSGMSETGKRFFYLSHPQIQTATKFNEDCRRVEKFSPILGCYSQSTNTIYIYDVKNPELDGVKEVTAAHEMLHAVYARLSQKEKSQLDSLLEQTYQTIKTDELAERMAYYERAQPGSRTNELHSTIGTEYAAISKELEQHYARYFRDRSAVVKLHAQYSSKFTRLEDEANRLHDNLQSRKTIIESQTAAYAMDVERYNQRVSTFNQQARNNEFTSRETFINQRNDLEQQLTQLNQRRQTIRQEIDMYNADVARLNELGVKINTLNKSLDSVEGVQ